MSLVQKIQNDRTKIRTALTVAVICARFMSSASFEDEVITNNGTFNDMAAMSGLIVLSNYLSFYKPASTIASLFVELFYFILVSLVVYTSMVNYMSSTQAFLAILLGLTVSYGLFQRGGFQESAVSAPFMVFIGLLLRGSEHLILNVASTFLIIDGMLGVIRVWADDRQTPFIFVALCGAMELLSKSK